MSDNEPFYPQFSLEQDQQRADIVKKANETYIEGFKAILDDYNKLEVEYKTLERENIVLQLENVSLRKLQFVVAFLQFFVLILVGVGINRLTSTPPDFISGWILIGCCAILQLASIIIFLLPKLGGKN